MSDTTPNLIPSVDEVIERAEKVIRKDKAVSKDQVRLLNRDNTWNKEGILSVFDESEDTMVYCEASGIPLFFTDRNGREWVLESYGYCSANGKPYHMSQLHMHDDVSKTSYPVVYEGCMSQEEYNKPLTPEEEAEIRRLHKL